jgi:hypothetical protein
MANESVSYEFRIRGYNSTSTYSGYATITAQTSGVMAPTGLILSSASTSSVTVTWTENSSVDDGYEVYYDDTLFETTAANATTSTITGLTTDQTYTIKVRAKDGTAYSAYATDTIKVGVAPDAVAVIGTVTVVSSSALTVGWTCAATNETGFCVYRSTDNVTYTLINTGTTANSTSYADTGLLAHQIYYYKIQAYNSYGVSAMSSAASETTSLDLDPPTALIADAISSTRIDLSFTVNATSATTHSVERKVSGGSYSAIGSTTTATEATYADGTCAADTEYTYRIRAYHSTPATYGDYSAPVSKRTLAVGTDTVRRNEAFFAMGNILYVASETPQNSFASYWRSKPMDFSEADPADSNKDKTAYMVQLEYTDTYASVPVVVSLSSDGGTTWVTASETIGTGDGTDKSQNFWFSGLTGKYITLKASVTSATKGFTWTGITVFYISRGEHMEAT